MINDQTRPPHAAFLLLFLVVSLLWLTRSGSPPEHRAIPTPVAENTQPAASPDLTQASKPFAGTASERIDSEKIWEIDLAGQPLSITLALDEAVLRDANGKESITRLIPPATLETLPARLAELSAPRGVFPVAYLAGKERSTSTRRLVTPDLRVQLDSATAEKIAASHQLVIKDRPNYAPGWVIMSARNSFAALDAMANLRGSKEVASADVLLAVQHSLRALPNDPLVTNQWHLKRSGGAVVGSDMNIETVWNYPSATGTRGTGIRIGIVDDGLETAHPDLSPNTDTINDKDWNGDDFDPNPDPEDDHGTACAGLAAARGNNNIGVTGSAPEATLVGMRLIAESVTDAQEAEAMMYLPEIIQIKSNSWGPDDDGYNLTAPGPLTLAALETATTTGRGGKGSIFLWSGGNGGDVEDNSNYDGYANSIYTIAIGATDSDGLRSYYSEPGSNLLVCAPSNGRARAITTTDLTGRLGYNDASSTNGGDYTNDFGGTSAAAPSNAGVVALMLEKNPALGWRDVQEILIRTAAQPPASTGWATNPAGLDFNHDFGAGLIDATAAVDLAATWANLPVQTSVTSSQTALATTIPDNNPTGATLTFDLSASSIRVEHVTLTLSATHTARGNLQITLTSPGGMSSTLADVNSDSNDDYTNWTFSSVRNWGEVSTGTWTLKAADLSSDRNTTGGSITAASLKIFGSPRASANFAPIVQILQPTVGQTFSPNTAVSVNVTATDLTMGGTPGSVTQVELFDNGVSLGIDTTAPYSFSFTPTIGNHSLIAKATDSETAIGASVSVDFSVVNKTPIIIAAALSATGQSYSDIPLTVAAITATDPEGSSISYSYQWQSSINQMTFTDVLGATSSTVPSLAGRLLRCAITATDGNSTSTAFTTAAVNLLSRPGTLALAGAAYSYTSGLVLRGAESAQSRQAIINEFSQGPSGTAAEWVEILTLKTGSLAYWDLSTAFGHVVVFLDDPIWNNIPAGTTIVIYNGDSKDLILPADDLDPSDGRMIVSSTNPTYFDNFFDPWLDLTDNGDAVGLADEEGQAVHSFTYGDSDITTPNIGNVGEARAAYFAGDTDTGADLAANWRTTTSLTTLPPRWEAADLPISFGGPWSRLPNSFTATGMNAPYGASLIGDTAAGSAKFGDQADAFTVKFSSRAASLRYRVKGTPATGTTAVGTFLIQQSSDGTAFTTLRTITNPTNTDTAYTNTPAAATRFIRFIYQSKTSGDIQLDKLAITPFISNALTLSVSRTTFEENLGAAAATGTVRVPTAPTAALTVSLASFDTTEVTTPATVTIAAGQTSSPPFTITAVDDSVADGPQQVLLTASASGYALGANPLTVLDNETTIEGVTPAAGNNTANIALITALRNGNATNFRFGAGSVIPTPLTLDPVTGILAGTIDAANPPGAYPIVIERYNSLGETVSQTYTLNLSSGIGNSYANWISTYNGVGILTAFDDDADGDGLPNGVENYLGTPPNSGNGGLTQISSTPGTLVFRHSRTNTPATDLTASYEWSADLIAWQPSDATSDGTTVTIAAATITDAAAPANDLVEVTATVNGTPRPRLFLRLVMRQ